MGVSEESEQDCELSEWTKQAEQTRELQRSEWSERERCKGKIVASDPVVFSRYDCHE